MTSTSQTKHHCTTWIDKDYTNFTWSLKDWSLIRDLYKTVTSPEFVLHNTDGETCKLNFKVEDSATASIDMQFPKGNRYHRMTTRLSFLSEKLTKKTQVQQTFGNSDKCYKSVFNMRLSNAEYIEYVQNDILTVFFEVTILKSVNNSAVRTEIQHEDFSTEICQKFEAILGSKDLYDVTFVVRGKKLYAHKVIVAVNSEVFKAMFTTEMKELKDGTVEIVDTDATVFEALLRYMYTGRVSDIENVVDELIVIAEKYQVMNLKELCKVYMLDHIDDNNVITYLLKAYQLSCNELQKDCIDFIRNNIHVLGNSSHLAKLYEYSSIVSKIFSK